MREHPKITPSPQLLERLERAWNSPRRGNRLPPSTPPIMDDEEVDDAPQ